MAGNDSNLAAQLEELQKAADKAESNKKRIEDESALVGKFYNDKKYEYEIKLKEYQAVKDRLGSAEDRRRAAEAELENMKKSLADAQKAVNEAEVAAETIKKENENIADPGILGPEREDVQKAQELRKKADAAFMAADKIKADAERLNGAVEDAKNALEDINKAAENAVDQNKEELLARIRKLSNSKNSDADNKVMCRLLAEYGLNVKGHPGEITIQECTNLQLADGDENEYIKASFNEVIGGISQESFAYFTYNLGSNGVEVFNKPASYNKGDYELARAGDGGFVIKHSGRLTRVKTPVVNVENGYGVAISGKVREVHEKTTDTEAGYITTEYAYDESTFERTVKVKKIDGTRCDIDEAYVAEVTGNEKLHENFNIEKDAEARKKDLEKKGYSPELVQTSSSGYKTYRITASRKLEPTKMTVKIITFRELDIYELKLEEPVEFINEAEVVRGNDEYQTNLVKIREKLVDAKHRYADVSKEAESVAARIKDAKESAKAADAEAKKAEQVVEEALAKVKKAEAEASERRRKQEKAYAELDKKRAEAEALKSKLEAAQAKLDKTAGGVKDVDSEISGAEHELDIAKANLDKALKLYEDSKKSFEKADAKYRELSDRIEALTASQKTEEPKGHSKKGLKGLFSAFSGTGKN